MASTFAEIVKSQRLDRQQPGRRGFDAQNLLLLSERMHTGKLTAHKKQRSWFRRLMAFVSRWRVL